MNRMLHTKCVYIICFIFEIYVLKIQNTFDRHSHGINKNMKHEIEQNSIDIIVCPWLCCDPNEQCARTPNAFRLEAIAI